MMGLSRKPNMFESILLIIGVVLIVLGYYVIYKVYSIEGALNWNLLQTLFLWILMILLIIVAAVNENMKEELKIIASNQLEEVKMLRKELTRRRF
ncbi:MAG TPA: DmsC/YnfH family molybdoenzyme membrane anchor subunit [Candidatus Nanoarchaeia archaeon]|nr:DmsC/YnfH family molybdoenzyme membrane anchor subunit [Candidatus Nanoarchaeia archaeon]